MATVTIRNLDDEIVEKLKYRAKRHNRSLEAELRQLLTDAVQRGTKNDLWELADRIAALTPDVSQTDSAELLREDRDR